jgi:RsiW-degrading membrane proteinase PrsW (M82 family)
VAIWLEEGVVRPATIAIPAGSDQQKPLAEWPEFADVASKVSHNPPPLPPNVPPPVPVPAGDSGSVARKPSKDGESPLAEVRKFIRAWSGLEPLADFKLRYLFSDTFTRRTFTEADTLFNCGCDRTTPPLGQVGTHWPRPWFFARLLIFGAFASLGFWFGAWYYENANMIPGLIIVSAFFVPLTCVALFFELNVPRNISFYRVTEFITAGGLVSLIITLFLGSITKALDNLLGAMSAGVIEEPAKVLAAVVLLYRARQYKWTVNGILVGAAVGAGFAGFESAGYIFRSLLGEEGLGPYYAVIIQRAIFAPFCHVVWTASIVGALWRVKSDRPFQLSMLVNKDFLRILSFVVMLHMLWNSGLLFSRMVKGYPLVFLWLLSLVGSWYLVLLLVQEGLRQVATAKRAAAGVSQEAGRSL